jgi:hypothetical protein
VRNSSYKAREFVFSVARLRSSKGVQIASKIAFVTRGENALPANLWPMLNLACGRLETLNPRQESASAGVQTLASLGWTEHN